MAFDIKAKAEEIVNKIKNDKDISSKFQKDPAGCIKEISGIDIPEDQLNQVVTAVKAKLTADDISGVAGKLGGLFKK